MDKKSKILIYTGLLLLTAALLITLLNIYADASGRKASENALDAVQTQIDSAFDENTLLLDSARRELSNKGKTDVKVEDYVIPDYVINPTMDMHVLTVDGVDYIGVLEIPSLGLKLPIISEWDYPSLKISPCRYTGSAYLNNMVIAAHNYNSHFGTLRELSYGDELTFADADGNEFFYKVLEVETLKPTAIDEMKTGDWDLTLFTCTVGGQARVTVRCELIDTVQSGIPVKK